MSRTHRIALALFLAAALVSPTLAQQPHFDSPDQTPNTNIVSADTIDTEIGDGIQTSVDDAFGDGTNVQIRTSISSVTFGKRKKVQRKGLTYFEMLGSVQGSAWGGEADTLDGPGPTFDAESFYEYDVPFVLRWPRTFDGTLVYYAHGYPNLGLNLLAESELGDANELRRIDQLESLYVADGALAKERSHAVFAPNLSGIRRDGSIAARALEGPFAGEPINLTVDATITRDLAQVAKRLLARESAHSVDRTIGVGHSGGALVLQYIASGVTTTVFEGPHFGLPVFTGGNFVTAYDPSSGVIFDGVIPIAGGDVIAHPEFPATVPMMLVSGNSDYSAVSVMRYASRVLREGVDLNDVIRIYQVGNLPHNFAEIVEATPNFNGVLADVSGIAPSPDSERMAPLVAALIDRMKLWIADGTAPPVSRINGAGVDTDADGAVDAIDLTLAGGTTTRFVPFAEDPANDRFTGQRFQLSVAAGFPSTTMRYNEVLVALDHESQSLTLPYAANRVGGFTFGFHGDASLVAFEDLESRWPGFKAYRTSVAETMTDLAGEGLYDAALGKRVIHTQTIKGLFGRATSKPMLRLVTIRPGTMLRELPRAKLTK